MSAHAYLIMAYSEYDQLKMLIQMLDYPENDIYVHIDKRSPHVNQELLRDGLKYSTLEVYQEMPIYWGHFSQTECELFLLEMAIKKKYQYIHLLSGADLPLCGQKEIHTFFEINEGKEFVRYWGPEFPETCDSWIRYYHPFQRYLRISKKRSVNRIFEVTEKCIEKAQGILHVNRIKNKAIEFQKGATWFSVTGDFAEYVVKQKDWVRKQFSNTRSSDEVFLQTILHNSPFEKKRFEESYETDGLSGIRYIDWKRGTPYTFRENDYDELMQCGYLFARKFSMSVDRKIVEKIYKKVLHDNEISIKTC